MAVPTSTVYATLPVRLGMLEVCPGLSAVFTGTEGREGSCDARVVAPNGASTGRVVAANSCVAKRISTDGDLKPYVLL